MRKHVTFGLVIFALFSRPCVAQPPSVKESSQKLYESTTTSLVVAQGVGTNGDEALRDAFRESVRQAVGLFVDAQTQIKNDELIEDRVLTYSNAYVKTYRKISESTRGGLVRIKISALVQKTKLIEKLKAENISIKKVDGKGLFAEAITQMEKTQSGNALLASSLEGFPESLVTASVTKPVRNVGSAGDSATIEVDVEIGIDMEAYRSFSRRLSERLAEIADEKGEFTCRLRPEVGHGGWVGLTYFRLESHDSLVKWMPKAIKKRSGISSFGFANDYDGSKATIAVSLSRSSRMDRMETVYYRLPLDTVGAIQEAASRATTGKMQLLDRQGNVVLADRFDLKERVPRNTDTFYGSPLTVGASSSRWRDLIFVSPADQENRTYNIPKYYSFMWFHPQFSHGTKGMKPTLTITRKINLSLDELKSVSEVKCEVLRR